MNLVGRTRGIQDDHSALPAADTSAIRLGKKHRIFRSLLDAAGRRTCAVAGGMRLLQGHIDGAGRLSGMPASTSDECRFGLARPGNVNVLVRRDTAHQARRVSYSQSAWTRSERDRIRARD